ncbi:unnamed protein product, partial [Prorocentrum cordatum]
AEDAHDRDEKPDAGSGGGSKGEVKSSSGSGKGGRTQCDRRGSWSRGDWRDRSTWSSGRASWTWRLQAARAAQACWGL